MNQNKYVKIYTDIVNGEKLLTDYDYCFKDPNLGHGFTEHANGMIWEVEGKELKCFDKDKLRAYMKKYLAKLHHRLVEYQRMTEFFDDQNSSFMVYKDLLTASPSFKPIIELVIEFIGNQLDELRVFNANKPPEGSLVFQYKHRTNTLVYFSFGLEEELSSASHLQFGIDIGPDRFVYGNQEKSESRAGNMAAVQEVYEDFSAMKGSSSDVPKDSSEQETRIKGSYQLESTRISLFQFSRILPACMIMYRSAWVSLSSPLFNM